MIEPVNDATKRTHRITGMPREKIVRRALIRNDIMYGIAGDGPDHGRTTIPGD
jgi:hypothetical protein